MELLQLQLQLMQVRVLLVDLKVLPYSLVPE
jgi:hypothetical protein